MNPANTKETEDFVFHIYDPVGNMIGSTVGQEVRYTPYPGYLLNVSSSRGDPTVGALASPATNSIEFLMESANYLASNELIEFKVPHTQFTLVDATGAVVVCESSGPLNEEFVP